MKRIKPTNILIVLAVFISIGFAYLSTNLNINGLTTFKKTEWDVHFDNIDVDSGSVQLQTGDYAPTISNDGLTVSYKVTCNIPGEYYKFNIDVVNDGNLNAKINSITTPTIPQGYEDNILFSLKYLDGTNVETGDVILKGEKVTYEVTTKNSDDISASQLIDTNLSIPMELSIEYQQVKTTDITKATFKPGWEVSTLIYNLSEQTQTPLSHAGYATNTRAFLRSETLEDNTNIISTNDSDVPIYMWYEDSDEVYDAINNIYYGNIYWYSEAEVVYFNEDSSFFFNHDTLTHGYYLDEDYEYTQEDEENCYIFGLMNDISGITQINTSKLENISNMFDRCCQIYDYSLLKSWNTSNVTEMKEVFSFNTSVTSLNYLSDWDVSNVTDMTRMFYYMRNINDLSPLEDWNTESLTVMSEMFQYVYQITNLTAISSWDVSNVEIMSGMFLECGRLSDISGISGWDVSNVTDMSTMFSGCSSLADATCLNGWNVSNVIDMGNMFFRTAVTSSTRPSWYS